MLRLLLLGLCGLAAFAQEPLTNDSLPQPEVPKGHIEQFQWTSDEIYPGTERDVWVYIPAQYDGSQPAAVMIFQDGRSFVQTEGDRAWMTPVVFDNLIHQGDMPVAVGVFVQHGVLPAPNEESEARYHRSFEYDALSDRYARFLLEEILPEVSRRYDLKLTDDPNLRAIAGSSSGGIAAFTAAWQRPDAFRRVVSFIGSYVNLRGGDVYPGLIRKREPQPLRVWLHDGKEDQDIWAGDWYSSNLQMATALNFSGYAHKFVVTNGGHENTYSRVKLPDALRWVWEDWGEPIEARYVEHSRESVQQILDPAEGWELVAEGYRFTEGPSIGPDGRFYWVDGPNNKIYRLDDDGKPEVFVEDSRRVSGMMFGPDKKLYGCQSGTKSIVRYDLNGREERLASVADCNDVAVTQRGDVYFTGWREGDLWRIPAGGGEPVQEAKGLGRPNGLVASPDQSLLLVNNTDGRWVWSFAVQEDGSLAHGVPFYRLETDDESSVTRADGMTVSSGGLLLVATGIGLQVCDATGRTIAILDKPQPGSLSNVVFAGEDLSTIYVTARDKVFKRKLRIQGVRPWEPVKPPRARL